MQTRLQRQLQATQHLVNFVCENDGPKGLLIVYYAGHGWAEPQSDGHLQLAGRFPDRAGEKDRSIDWTKVEHTLEKTESDVLVVFDCCHAGLLCRPASRGPRRSFYYVAACKADQITQSSGDGSFTTAMVWALTEMASRSGFTVTKLIQKLMEYKSFPRGDQQAVIYPSRFGPGDREIWIAPNRPQETESTSPTLDSPSDSGRGDKMPTADILDLRFHFKERATASEIEHTAMALRDILDSERFLHFHHISFIDHTSFVEWSAKHWLAMVTRRKSLAGTGSSKQRATLVRSTSIKKPKACSSQRPVLDSKNITRSPATTTTVVAAAAVAVSSSSDKETQVLDSDGVLFYLGMALSLAFQDWRLEPLWHPSL